MKTWVAAGTLFILPLGLFFVAGAMWLAEQGKFAIAALALVASWGAGGYLIWRWIQRVASGPLAPADWSSLDREALKVIKSHQSGLRNLSRQQLTDLATQERVIRDLALELARHYHPGAEDCFSPLTLDETLVAAQCLVDDTSQWVEYYVPGSRQMTVERWRQMSQVAANLAADLMLRILMRNVGSFLIELYSGRLRSRAESNAAGQPRPAEIGRQLVEVTIAVIGQSHAGKSSLIRALLGPDRARTDWLPSAKNIHRHRVLLDQPLARLIILEADLSENAEAREYEWICDQSRIAIYVCDATRPLEEARAAVEMLLQACDSMPVIAVLTHVDLLIETSHPPVALGTDVGDVDALVRESIAQRMREWRSEFPNRFADVIPVCLEELAGDIHGVAESILPAVTNELDEREALIFLQAIKLPASRGEEVE